MKHTKKMIALILSFSLLISGCSHLSIPTNINTAFENFTFSLFQQDVVSTTLGLHYTLQSPEAYGISNTEITLGSFETDPSSSLASLENCKALLERFSYESLSKENQLTYDVLSSYINTSMEGAAYTLYEEPLSPLTGIHAQLPVLLAEYAFHSKEDVETYLQLLTKMPSYFDSLILFEQEKATLGLFMADYAVDSVLEQCNAFIAMNENNYLLSTFKDRLDTLTDLSETDKNSYLSQNNEFVSAYVIPSYQKLVSALETLKGSGKNELGLCYLPKGRDYYSYLVCRETCSLRSIDEIIALIENQIADDILKMQDTLSENPSAEKTISSPSESSPDFILDDLLQKTKNAFPTAPEVTIEIKYVPTALEPYLSPAFYLTPTIDNISENVIYINQAHEMEDINLFTTLAHEGYPGHLYQTTYYASKKPDPLRTLFPFKGYVEGWATYAEMCSYYLTSLEKPYASLLQKNNSLILGLYAMADIGIHYQGWDLKRTIEFFKTYGIEDEKIIQEIFESIIEDPANYLTYYVGYLEILELKKSIIEKEGENFSQKDFHRKILDVGPAPFDILEKYVCRDAS